MNIEVEDSLVSAALKRYPNLVDVSEDSGFQVATEIRRSAIPNAGLGRFVLVGLRKGDVIRKCMLGSENLHYFESIEDMKPRIEKDGIAFFEYFGFVGPQDNPHLNGRLLANNPPLFVNHPTTTGDLNIHWEWRDNILYTKAARDIKAGEELYQDYRDFDKLDWYESFMKEKEIDCARKLGEMLGVRETAY
mmetsp:Transcript_18554/g.28048  ORF Transcript_18554/g.28048 Transcript_18554/m.28048 type:complete len:191 (-) Transcript_18554:74-646(-)|eukprot:CAMPEP_0178907288 /NCGR_PEP_ID=MMETSP0786-20121207/7286_1 /TAXON_ID=186022 /ORGANISM="Thalassionema frauenfeldii, Strain CCMP 1798" /LENGTH=190 /DNA_ID=CAMNT_0020579067 /DNA_START=41 /DNA_END=613 /DNA_ORIENTATION=-